MNLDKIFSRLEEYKLLSMNVHNFNVYKKKIILSLKINELELVDN
ncbi:hypothetical protein RBU49_00410 [Clostridium sp. MB40-C1]|nr:hypothetical protein [Clostridium sp. MB40-C1]WMJ80742.1 hypothetical protein RBU49_00410 [Clostridium sp. MB40-C1]